MDVSRGRGDAGAASSQDAVIDLCSDVTPEAAAPAKPAPRARAPAKASKKRKASVEADDDGDVVVLGSEPSPAPAHSKAAPHAVDAAMTATPDVMMSPPSIAAVPTAVSLHAAARAGPAIQAARALDALHAPSVPAVPRFDCAECSRWPCHRCMNCGDAAAALCDSHALHHAKQGHTLASVKRPRAADAAPLPVATTGAAAAVASPLSPSHPAVSSVSSSSSSSSRLSDVHVSTPEACATLREHVAAFPASDTVTVEHVLSLLSSWTPALRGHDALCTAVCHIIRVALEATSATTPSALFSAPVVEIVLQALAAHPQSVELLCEGLHALALLCQVAACVPAILHSPDGVPTVVSSLDFAACDRMTCLWACTVVAAMCGVSRAARLALAKHSGFSALLSALDAHISDAEVQAMACRALARLVAGVADSQALIVPLKAHLRVYAAMDAHVAVPDVQEAACALLSHVTLTEDGAKAVINSDGVRRLQRCVDMSSAPAVVELAGKALHRLSYTSYGKLVVMPGRVLASLNKAGDGAGIAEVAARITALGV